MDATALAVQVTAILAPFLPHLVEAGRNVAEGAGKELEEHSWNLAKTLWGRLRPKVDGKPAAREAARDAAASPGDADLEATLRVQIRKLLSEDAVLAEELSRLLTEAERPVAAVTVTASGRGAVAAGGNINRSTIVTGDRNRVGRSQE